MVKLPKRGVGSGRNDFLDLLTGRSRLTTPSERKQSIVLEDHLGRSVKRPGGGAIRVKPFGLTTLDEGRKKIRESAKRRRKHDAETESLTKESGKLKTLATANALVGTSTPKKIGKRAKQVAAELDTRGKKERNTQAEGMLSALDNLSRPYYGVTGAGKAIVQGKRPDRVANEAAKGLALKTKTEAWDVLDAAGVKNKYVKYGAGIPASILVDPLSYVSAAAAPATGGGSLAALSPKATKIAKVLSRANSANPRKAARGAKALEKLVKGGNVPHGPLTADDAFKLAAKKKGVKLRVGARVPGTQKFVGMQTSGKTTAKLRNKARPPRANAARDEWVKAMSPTGRMASTTEKESDTVLAAAASLNETETRAGALRKQTEKGMRAALRREIGISRADRILKPRKSRAAEREANEAILREIEATGKTSSRVGKYGQQELRRVRGAENREGIPTPKLTARSADEAQGYVPRYWESEIDKRAHRRAKRLAKEESPKRVGSKRNPQAGYAIEREVRQKLADLPNNPAAPNNFSRDFIGTTAKRRADSELDIARHRFNQAIKSTGRKANAGEASRDLPTGQSVYEVGKKGELKKIGDGAVPTSTKKEFVVLKDSVVDRATEIVGGTNGANNFIGRAFDKTTGKWKGSVTVWWPGYYARNLVGDTMLGMQAGTDVRSGAQSLRINRASRKREKILRKGQNIDKGKDPDAALKKLSFKIDGKTYSGKELEDLALEHAAIGGGQHGSEVAQLVGKEAFSTNNPAARLNIRRENLPRRATFIAGMKRGMSPSKAAAHSRREHFDYGTRTEFQKQVRRVIPFFSWWDLNTRKQLKQLVTSPGKSLSIYHVLNGASSAAGYANYREYLANMNTGKQKGLPIPIVYGWNKDGSPKIKDVQFGNVLSELRTALRANPKKMGDEVLARANPLVKTPLELLTNHSGFFGGAIEPDYASWTPAPTALGKHIGKAGKDTFVEKALNTEIVMKLDRKSGKYVPQWKRKTDYAIRSLGPWAGLGLGTATKGTNTGIFEKSQTDSALAVTGISPSTHFPKQAELGNLYDKRGKLMTARNGLSHVKGSKLRRKNLTRRIDALTDQIHKAEKQAGYKKPTSPANQKKPLTPKQQIEKELGIDKIKKRASDEKKAIEKELGIDKLKKEAAKGLIGSSKPKKKSVVAKAGKPKLGTNEPDLRKLVRTEAVKNGLDPDLEEARIQQESGFQRRVTSSAGAQGVAQIMPGTAASWKVDPNDPVAAIKVSSKKMAEYTKAHGSYAKALVAYNAGPGRVGKPLYKETANYVANISQMAGKSAERGGGEAAASSSVRQVKNQITKKTGLKVTSTFRNPKHNAAVGGVPNSYHTRGSKKNPKAADFVGTRKQMERGAAIARRAGLSGLIHDAGSGVHLHIQDDGAAMGGGGGSSAPSGGGSYQMASGGRSASSRGQTIRRRGETASNYFDTAEGRMALLDFVRSKSKDRTKKLIFAMKAAQA